jgi:hypothetical protein
MSGERRDSAVRSLPTKEGSRDEMIKASIRLQDLRRKIYQKGKAEIGRNRWSRALSGYVGRFESVSSAIGHINLLKKLTGKRSAGNRHAAFDEAGAGDVLNNSEARQSPTLLLEGLVETGRWKTLNGHEAGNGGHSQGNSCTAPRHHSTRH